MPPNFIHSDPQFRVLLDLVAREQQITDPSLVEKDYWIMHVLYGLKSLGLRFELKGGTSLSKGFGIIHRFSEDIDIRVETDPKFVEFEVHTGKNHDKQSHRDSRRLFFDWLAHFLKGRIGGIVNVTRDSDFDDTHKWRNGGIRLHYEASFPAASGLKDGILLEVGFDRTAPNQLKNISSWVFEKAKTSGSTIIDNRALDIPCYEPRYTFVEKLQTVVRKYRLFKDRGGDLPANLLRHYYDLYQLISLPDIQAFIGTQEYSDFKTERFGGDDTKISNSPAFRLDEEKERKLFETSYRKTKSLYYRGQPSLSEILDRLQRDIERL